MIVFVLVPVVVYGTLEVNTGAESTIWGGETSKLDFFHKAKAGVLLFALPLLLVLMALSPGDLGKLRFMGFDKPVYGYYFFVMLSSIFSGYGWIVYFGVNGRYEGLFIITVYVLLFLMAYLWGEENRSTLITMLVIGAVIVTVIGVPQYFSLDFFRSTLGRRLITPSKLGVDIDKLVFRVGDKTVYSTLYNPNYIGSYYTLLIPALVGITVTVKNHRHRIGLSLLTAASVFSLFGSRSSAGMTGLAVILLFAGILLVKRVDKKIVGGVLIGLLIAVAVFNQGVMSLVSDYQRSFVPQHVGEPVLEKLRVDGPMLRFEFRDEADNFNFLLTDGGQLHILDGDYQKLDYDFDAETGEFHVADEAYGFFDAKVSKDNIIDVNFKRSYLRLVIHSDGIRILSMNNQLVEEAVMAPSIGLEGYGHIGSGRGYIWSRTLPLLKDKLIIGSGPDSYVFEFPQEDILGRVNEFGRTYITVDKPHNLYLQMSMNSGMISLVLFLAAAAYVVLVGFYRIFKEQIRDPLAVGLYFGILGYLVTSFFNDSVVSIAPIFWVFFGYFMAQLHRVKGEVGK
ncbi:MAG: hypothetical protein AVO33_07430 [delta proteobacterium ML8_F1]|nr:MAG: hypothetical protein AVO33_07430 [delta proteobacterium ML8_F1]